jgi:hypothetical protein
MSTASKRPLARAEAALKRKDAIDELMALGLVKTFGLDGIVSAVELLQI